MPPQPGPRYSRLSNYPENRWSFPFSQQQEMEGYVDLMAVSSNPAKQKKSRGSALVTKKKHQPDMSQMSQTTEFKGKIN